MQVMLERPQETLMWEAFAECVYGIRAGKPPVRKWLDESALTQKVLSAIYQSALADGAVVKLDL
jgi:hypothetical protein